ncbi:MULTISPECIES: UvrD-helicase domain-containing protein [unclassified Bradyrhizobium]|uniref:UvrD-helicase domain-containing protein n=1 Tax=unclassified Bradyrhizobium TaxID=2631580 RepID=UPI002FF08852
MGEVIANSNIALDDHVESEIAACLDLEHPRSFFLYAGAGSGKTSSLIHALEFIKEKNIARMRLGGQRVAVITYTNAACDEIVRRLKFDPTYQVSTIHSFAWSLISGFNKDIREWLRKELQSEIREIQQQEANGRVGTKASIARLAQIEAKGNRLNRLNEIKKFTYSPTGDNKERGSLNHAEVIEIFASFLTEKPLMQSILVNQFPFLLVDESQDTNKRIVDALLIAQASHAGKFSLGFIGDTMQRIYNDGKERIEEELPVDWARPAKRLNHRCPKRIVRLINQVRGQVDSHTQEARSDSIEGILRLFVFPADAADKAALESSVRSHMATVTGDADWNEREKCKILTLEHHMAAKRMGFATVFEALSNIDDFRTGLLDGTLPAIRLFTANILPLVIAQQKRDKFSAAKVMRDFSPLLSAQTIKDASNQSEQLRTARDAAEGLAMLWDKGEPRCGAVLRYVAKNNLFLIPESLKAFVPGKHPLEGDAANAEAESTDPLAPENAAIESFLEAPFSEIAPYARYVSDMAEFGTHQGVKGLEFDRVMVVMDDAEARGFMFGYEKFFGAKQLTTTDLTNEAEGRDSAISRTRRLFYVTCSRAKRSLALVAYSSAPASVRMQMIESGWFEADEIILAI